MLVLNSIKGTNRNTYGINSTDGTINTINHRQISISESKNNRWLLDSGTTDHICNDLSMFADYKSSNKIFEVPGGKSRSKGVGTVNLKVFNRKTNSYDVIVLKGVSYIENAPNLIATGKLNKINLHIDTVRNVIFHNESSMHEYKISVSEDNLLVLPCITGILLKYPVNIETDHLVSKQALRKASLNASLNVSLNASQSYVVNDEYHEDIKLNADIFNKLNEKYGPFNMELFASEENHLLPSYITAEQNSFLQEWTKRSYYGNPKYDNDTIYRVLDKAVNDFRVAPDNTKFCFILPKWINSPWYKTFINYFQILETFPSGTEKVFTIPVRPHFTSHQTETSADGRAFMGSLPWDVIVIYKDKFTITGINSALRAHLRFGHVSLNKLLMIQKNGIPTGSTIDAKICDIHCSCCYLTKAKRVLPVNRAPKRRRVLQSQKQGGTTTELKMRTDIEQFGHLVFTDILYMNIPSYEGFLYVIHFVDYASRYCKSYFIRKRDEVYDKLQSFIDWVKTQVHVKKPDVKHCVRIILSDRAGEYVSDKWKEICTLNSVQYQYTNTDIHEEADIAERVWLTLQDSMRAMMCTAQFLKKEWSLAFSHAVWLYNRTPHDSLSEMSPLEYVTGLKPDLTQVKIFGCKAYKFQLKRDRCDKLANRAKSCFYVGQTDERTNTFLFYFRDESKVEQGGIGKFDENINEYGKLLSTFDSTYIHNFEVKTMRPEPYMDVEQYDSKVKSVNDVDVYFDTTDNETYLVLHITTLNNDPQTGIWIRASSLFKNNSNRESIQKMNKHNISLLYQWYNGNKKKAQSLHPMMKEVWVRYLYEKKEPEYCHAFVVGNDPRHIRKWSVIHISDGFHEDVRDDNVIWELNQVTHPNRILAAKSHSAQDCYGYLESFNGEFYLLDPFDEKLTGIESLKTGSMNIANKEIMGNSNSISRIINDYLDYKEPLTYREALRLPDAAEWQEATDKEMQQFDNLKAMIPINAEDIPKGKNIVESKIVFKLKLNADGSIDKYKARLVAKGFTQVYGLDFTENFSPTPMVGGVRFVIIFILHHKLKRAQGDVSGAFLNSKLKEEIYIKLPEGLKFKGSSLVRLIKSLYGLKQAARDWYELSDYIIRMFDPELKRSRTEPCIYYKIEKGCTFIISVHVDDYIIGYENDEYFAAFIKHFSETIKITVKNEIDFMLQMKLDWTENTVSLSQNRQIQTLVNKFNVAESKKTFNTPMEAKLKLEKGDVNNLPDVPYRELVCSLLFIGRYTRPDVLFAVTILCRFLTCYTETHWKAAKRVLIYLKNTEDIGLVYTRNLKAPPLELYVDSDWGSDQIDGRSTSGVLINLYGNPVTWSSEKQSNVALSSSEAEYMCITSGFKETKYFINLMQLEMKIPVTPVRTRIDNIGAGYMAEQSVTNKRTKHINLRYHYVREEIQEFHNFDLNYIDTKNNTSDIFTKPLDRGLFERHRNTLMSSVTRQERLLTPE